MAFSVQVSHGSDKHRVELPGPDCTVGQLRERLTTITEIPTSAQKVIFKGKTLSNEMQAVGDAGLKQGSKLILLGRKFTDEQETALQPINAVLKVVDGVEKRLQGIREEIEGIEKGFVPPALITQACHGLQKRCVSCSEVLMQNIETLDGILIPASESLVRGKRKAAITRINTLLRRSDELSGRVAACRTGSVVSSSTQKTS